MAEGPPLPKGVGIRYRLQGIHAKGSPLLGMTYSSNYHRTVMVTYLYYHSWELASKRISKTQDIVDMFDKIARKNGG